MESKLNQRYIKKCTYKDKPYTITTYKFKYSVENLYMWHITVQSSFNTYHAFKTVKILGKKVINEMISDFRNYVDSTTIGERELEILKSLDFKVKEEQ